MKKLISLLFLLFLILSSAHIDAKINHNTLEEEVCSTTIHDTHGQKDIKLTANTRGNAPFKYKWTNGESSQSIKVVKAGKYCVKVIDDNGCESKACFEVKDRENKCTSAIQARKSSNATKLTVVSRGKAPFKYKWNTGETTQSILAKKSGKYCVKVIDAIGCESDACFEVKNRDTEKCKTKIRHRRSSKGGVLVAKTKGKAPFKYKWSTGENTRIIVVTKSGKYCVKVEDANGCVSEDCIEVKIRDQKDEKCKTTISELRTPNKVKGHVLVARTKGKAPFKYSWSTGETSQKIVITKPGTYCVKVQDADGCLSRACITIKDKTPGDDRCKTVVIAGRVDLQKGTKLTAHTRGKAPFKYKWSNGETSQTISVTKPGKYCVKVEDANGCVSGDCIEIKDRDEKKCLTEIHPERTRDSSIVILTARTKGKAPFKYKWSNGETSQSIKAKVPGKYCVKVIDADGCVSEACFELKDSDEKRCATTIQPERTRDSSIVVLTARTKGKAPFKYSWSNGETSQSIKAKVPGKYCVKVIDADGCVSDACFEIKKRGRFTAGSDKVNIIDNKLRGDNIEFTHTVASAYPNPIIDQINLNIESDQNQKVQYSLYKLNGQLIQSESFNINNGENNYTIKTNNLSSGQYLLNLIYANGVQNIKLNKN